MPEIADKFIKDRVKNPIYEKDSWLKAFVGGVRGIWWHVHRDEIVPEGNVAIVIPLANMESHFHN